MSHSYNKIWEESFWALVLPLIADWGLVAGFYGAYELHKGAETGFWLTVVGSKSVSLLMSIEGSQVNSVEINGAAC